MSALHVWVQKPGTATVYNGSVMEALNQAGIAAAGLDLQGTIFLSLPDQVGMGCNLVIWQFFCHFFFQFVLCVSTAGCGHSEGVRCYVDRYSDYVEEVLDFTRQATWTQSSSRIHAPGVALFTSPFVLQVH